ncbi:DnaJ homolog subfamily C member 2-like [Elysia marginata]|uniref:DnaJ homolog subfamily C member 2-like n=1 Tax=Elysia marginata TaxID=1093978 RepID=A0AAV4IST3_9GAST|nr:DnaJ homolog subfamily C member 2-like [Elysia marginata]
MNGILSPQEGETTCVYGKLSPLLSLDFEPVGRWFEAHHRRAHSQHSHSHHSIGGVSSSSESEEEEEEEDQFDEEDETLLLRLDPREWKKQDHYVVLGLSKLRHRASEDQIKRAYKQKVLTHHPDKRKAKGKKVKEGDDDYFTCITRESRCRCMLSRLILQQELMIEGQKRRWSTKRRVPKLGDENTPFEDVDHFYSFWYEFDSWREFSYLDEEEKEKGENRDERRWIEKQNKAARQKLKKEEVMRLRQLVDNAYACDPRILKFREEEKERKNAVKRARQEAARQRIEEEERKRQEILEEERKKKEKLEEEARAQAAIAKKEKEALKKQLKKERKTLRTYMKDNDYFAATEEERVNMLQEVDRVTELLSVTSLQSLNENLSKASKDTGKEIFMKGVQEVNDQLEEEKRKQLELTTQKSGAGAAASGSKTSWSEAETQALIKGVNLFPAGTQDR